VLHEGLIGVIGEEGLQEIDYSDVEETPIMAQPKATAGWLGITDKYWAATLDAASGRLIAFDTRVSALDQILAGESYQSPTSSLMRQAIEVPPGSSVGIENHAGVCRRQGSRRSSMVTKS
jgi:hypothetical protein